MSLLRVVDDMVMTESGLIPLALYIKASMDAAEALYFKARKDAEQDMMDMDVEIQHRHRAFASLLEEMNDE